MLVGWARGGRLAALGDASLRGTPWLGAALAMVVVSRASFIPPAGEGLVQSAGYLVALVFLWQNRGHYWTLPILIGLTLNGLVVAANGGRMPISGAALAKLALVVDPEAAVGFDPRHVLVGPGTRLAALGDLIPLRAAGLGAIVSPGDLLMALGLGGFVQGQMLARPEPPPG